MLNKAFLKVEPSRSDIGVLKKNLIDLLDNLDESNSEEHVKNDQVVSIAPDARNSTGVLI